MHITGNASKLYRTLSQALPLHGSPIAARPLLMHPRTCSETALAASRSPLVSCCLATCAGRATAPTYTCRGITWKLMELPIRASRAPATRRRAAPSDLAAPPAQRAPANAVRDISWNGPVERALPMQYVISHVAL